MKSRYVLVNEGEKVAFEKKWHLPYGYVNSPISTNPKEAGQWLDNIVELGESPKQWCVVSIDEYGSEKDFYRYGDTTEIRFK